MELTLKLNLKILFQVLKSHYLYIWRVGVAGERDVLRDGGEGVVDRPLLPLVGRRTVTRPRSGLNEQCWLQRSSLREYRPVTLFVT